MELLVGVQPTGCLKLAESLLQQTTYLAMDQLSELLCKIASHGERVAILYRGKTLTYQELVGRVTQFADFLISQGFGENRSLATALNNGTEQVIVHLGAFLAGVPLIRLRPTAPPPQLHHCLKTIQTHGLIATEEILDSVDHECIPECVIRNDWFDEMETPGSRSATSMVDLIRSVDADGERIATITFTSGTTARPKGVIHRRQAVANAIQRTIQALDYDADDVVLVRMALYAQIGMMVQALPALVVGARIDLATSAPVEAYHQAFGSTPTKTLLFDAPAILSEVMRSQDMTGFGMEQLRAIWAGGDFITPRIQARSFAISGRYISVAYGMTEVGLISVMHSDEENEHPQSGLVGFPLPDTQIRILDDSGGELPANQKGNIHVKTSSSFDGYCNLPELTSSVLDSEGWISTGDIGMMDESGRLHLLGRRKEMIVINGWKVAPVEIETVILSHPGVQQAAVVGVEEDEGVCRIEAFVVIREGFEPTPSREDLLELATERLEKFMIPSGIHFVQRLPYFPTGKIDRERLLMISLAGMIDELM